MKTSKLLLGLLYSACSCLVSAEESRMGDLSAEAKKFIIQRAAESKRTTIFDWLHSYCVDLSPYNWANPPGHPEENRGAIARSATDFLKPDLLPPEWRAENFRKTLGRGVRIPAPALPDTITSAKVPTGIVPVRSIPDGKPVPFVTWRYRNGSRTISFSFIWIYQIVVVTDENGFGLDVVNDANLEKLRSELFHFPPNSIASKVHEDSKIRITGRDGNFTWGEMAPLSKIDVQAGFRDTWNYGTEFFFDGRTFAFVLTRWDWGRIESSPHLGPDDME